ncbi:hypothetical protein D9M69_731340 [compost metagenome]
MIAAMLRLQTSPAAYIRPIGMPATGDRLCMLIRVCFKLPTKNSQQQNSISSSESTAQRRWPRGCRCLNSRSTPK